MLELHITKTTATIFQDNTTVTINWDNISELKEFTAARLSGETSTDIKFEGNYLQASYVDIAVTYDKANKKAFIAIIDEETQAFNEYTEAITSRTSITALLAELYIAYKVVPTLTIIHEPALMYDSKYLKVFNVNGFTYAQRLGKDSIAFVLYKKTSKGKRYGVISEPKPPLGQNIFLSTAFGGSLDKDIPLIQLVREEVLEESGYKVNASMVTYLDKVLVSTQMNQMCHLFLVDVTGLKMTGKTTEDPSELASTTVWLKKKAILRLQDWKAPTILAKYKAKK